MKEISKRFLTALRRNITQQRLAIFCTCGLALSLIPLLVMGFFSHPMTDDYRFGVTAHHAVVDSGSPFAILGAAAGMAAEVYQSWQGTFSAVFFMALQPAVFSEGFYALTPFLMLGALLSSTYFLLKTLLMDSLHMSLWDYLITSAALCFFSVEFLPSAFESFYWFNGSVFYTFFHSLLLFLLGVLLRFLRGERKRTWLINGIAGGVLAFVIGGGNYLTALLTAVLLFCLLVGTFLCRLPLWKRGVVALTLVLELLSFFISVRAPGNSMRQDLFTHQPNPLEAIFDALARAATSIWSWTTPQLLLLLLFLAPLFYRCAGQLSQKLSFSFPYPLAVLLFAWGLLGAEFTPPLYAMGPENQGAPRMTNILFYTFLLLSLCVLFYFCGWLHHRLHAPADSLEAATERYRRFRPSFLLTLAAAFTLTVFLTGGLSSLTTGEALRSLKNGEPQAYHAQMLSRIQLYLDPQVKDVVVHPLTSRPPLINPPSVPDISTDPSYKLNRRVKEYFRKDSVIKEE